MGRQGPVGGGQFIGVWESKHRHRIVLFQFLDFCHLELMGLAGVNCMQWAARIPSAGLTRCLVPGRQFTSSNGFQAISFFVSEQAETSRASRRPHAGDGQGVTLNFGGPLVLTLRLVVGLEPGCPLTVVASSEQLGGPGYPAVRGRSFLAGPWLSLLRG